MLICCLSAKYYYNIVIITVTPKDCVISVFNYEYIYIDRNLYFKNISILRKRTNVISRIYEL